MDCTKCIVWGLLNPLARSVSYNSHAPIDEARAMCKQMRQDGTCQQKQTNAVDAVAVNGVNVKWIEAGAK